MTRKEQKEDTQSRNRQMRGDYRDLRKNKVSSWDALNIIADKYFRSVSSVKVIVRSKENEA